MSDIRYIIFKGGLQPKNPMEATDDKLKELSSVGYRQGTDYDIVSLKVLEDMLGGKKFAHGGMMNMDEMTRPLGYKFGTKDGTLVGDRERDVEEDLKEWEKDAIDKLRRERDIEKLLEKMPEILDEFKTPEEFFKKIPDMEKEGELPDWVKEFLEKRRKDPFERLLPKREDEGEPFIPKFGDRFFLPPKKDPRYDPRYDPNFGDRFFFSPKKDPRLEEFLGDETSGLKSGIFSELFGGRAAEGSTRIDFLKSRRAQLMSDIQGEMHGNIFGTGVDKGKIKILQIEIDKLTEELNNLGEN